MFERFKKSHRTDEGASSVAMGERKAPTDDAAEDDRVSGDAPGATTADDRFARTPGERDRDIVAADSWTDRSGTVHSPADDDDRDGVHDDREAALDRDAARDDLARDDDRDRMPLTAGERDRGIVAGDSDRDADGVRDDREREHHGAGTAAAAAGAGAAGGAAAREHREGERDPEREPDIEGDRTTTDGATTADDRTAVRDRDQVDEPARTAPVMGTDALATMRARQRDRFGGIQWGSDFFGWLCAIGLASLLLAILVGAGVSLGLSTDDAANADTAETIGIGGGIALLAVLAIAWFCGGYVAGRMARFDGARQGVGVWLWTLLAAVVVAVLAAIGGSEFDVFERLSLPRIAVGDSTLTAGGAIAGVAAILVTLLFAVIGGKVGERFHKRVDRVATHEYVADR